MSSTSEPFIAIRPPEYFPGAAFMALTAASDVLVLADTFQYSRQSFQNRARIRKPYGAQWITIPLEHGQAAEPITGIILDDSTGWRKRHRKAIRFNYGSAPFFEHYQDRVDALTGLPTTCLADISCASVQVLARALGLDTIIVRASELEGVPARAKNSPPTGSVAEILAHFPNHTHLIPADLEAIDRTSARKSAILEFEPFEYRQVFDGFVPDLSFVDILFNHGPDSLRMLRQATHRKPLPR